MDSVKVQYTKDILMEDANRISKLIENQRHLCVSCPAFEEVIDTQLFGFSKKIEFAVQMDLLPEEDGHQMMADLEKHLNDVYNHAVDQDE
ncbi:Uncharacterized protein conserved in bacteria [Alloiococcus otitis]|uniref:Uncharacterized protein n=1 Tax=Alloiococcus otitis ATCC 51267 TaxID=883081 RepID=K9EY48_9LACT|nr:DUF1507 family protein [Alloiococcus otitis]EKU94160.1 hypothetical protein HMPREF9698_00192 [Alloiococcus otitis ATCC 51267]SUU81207.1 Uncharacterized protein conserved in bacteria [Alloiococcus otitis]